MISRQQFSIRVSRLRQDGDDAGAVDFWLHHGTGISWSEFQQIDPLCDFGEFAARKKKNAKRMEQYNRLSK